MTPTVIYDAHCCLCEQAREWVNRWDRKGRVRFLHFEDPQAISLQSDLDGLEFLEAIRFIDAHARTWKGAQGVLRLLRVLPFGSPLAWALSLPGAYGLAEKAYGWLARNRYDLFGRVRE